MSRKLFFPFALVATVALGTSTFAQQPTETDEQQRFARFEEQLTGATLAGKFTLVGGRSDQLHEEQYHIRRVRKLDEGNLWGFSARIKYGDHDVTVPMALEVLWAGDTPVITVSNVDIPGFGKVSARVVIHDNKYAGTWTHGEAHGHLFGTISKDGADEEEK